jgi:hypothetical protein
MSDICGIEGFSGLPLQGKMILFDRLPRAVPSATMGQAFSLFIQPTSSQKAIIQNS